MPEISYGIDLSGRSRDGCRVARAERAVDDSIRVELIPSVLCKVLSPQDLLRSFSEEVATWEPDAKVVVDVPIDLQDLHLPPNRQRIVSYWQLTLRPIDRALGALPALADRIGSTVALWRLISPFMDSDLGLRLFESYPAGSLRAVGLPHKNYKVLRSGKGKLDAIARMEKAGWVLTAQNNQDHPLPKLLNGLTIRAPEGTIVTHDDVDAVICAITGLPGEHVLEGEPLCKWAKSLPGLRQEEPLELPKGYRLYKGRPGLRVELVTNKRT